MQNLERDYQEFQFPDIPEPMQQGTNEVFRPFLNLFKEHFLIRDQSIQSPVEILRSFIHFCLNDNFRDFFHDIGEAQTMYMSISHNEELRQFFKFCRPVVRKDLNVSACNHCNAPEVLGRTRQDEEAMIQISTLHTDHNHYNN